MTPRPFPRTHAAGSTGTLRPLAPCCVLCQVLLPCRVCVSHHPGVPSWILLLRRLCSAHRLCAWAVGQCTKPSNLHLQWTMPSGTLLRRQARGGGCLRVCPSARVSLYPTLSCGPARTQQDRAHGSHRGSNGATYHACPTAATAVQVARGTPLLVAMRRCTAQLGHWPQAWCRLGISVPPALTSSQTPRTSWLGRSPAWQATTALMGCR